MIEADKRESGREKIEVALPYSKESFSVPANLYILGTMNTADRSVEALDTALRRRFSFEEILPEPERLSPHELFHSLLWKYKDFDWLERTYKTIEDAFMRFFGVPQDVQENRYDLWEKMKKEGFQKKQAQWLQGNYTGVRLDRVLYTINRRIEQLLDKDHTIGHAYFMSLADSIDPETELRLIFHNKIIPLLKEYFYGDLGRVQLILGRKFVKIETSNSNVFADSNYEGAELLSERTTCSFENIMAPGYNIVEAVKSIYEEFEFDLNENALEDGVKQITVQVHEA